MDNKDKSIIEKLLSISGVEACAISSLDGDVLQFSSNNEDLKESDIKRASAEISKLFSSYSISSIEIASLFLSFQSHNVILHSFGSGFIFIASKKNSNVNLVKMETSYLESEFVKIVNKSLGDLSSKSPFFKNNMQETAGYDINQTFPHFDENSFQSNMPLSNYSDNEDSKSNIIIPINVIIAIKDLFASSLGPIAFIIFESKIKELNQTVDNFNYENIEEFIKLLSKEIEDENDRILFVKDAKNILKTIQ
ncbi:MAG: hypothetical protein ACYDDE_09005 [bacterium]